MSDDANRDPDVTLYALELRITLDTSDEETATERADKITEALHRFLGIEYDQMVSVEVYTY